MSTVWCVTCLSVCQDAVEEPFVDVAVGGSELAGWEADNQLMVWAVTIRGRVSNGTLPVLATDDNRRLAVRCLLFVHITCMPV